MSKRKSSPKKSPIPNLDQHRWRKVLVGFFPLLISLFVGLVFYRNRLISLWAVVCGIVFTVVFVVSLLEWHIVRVPSKRRVIRIVALASIFLAVLGGGIWQYYIPPAKTWLVLSPEEKQMFINILRTQAGTKDHVRIGCAPMSEDICVRASSFVAAFKRGGFFVENDQVERVALSHPAAGVVLVTYGHADQFDPQDADAGKWSELTESVATIDHAFAEVGINPSLASDEALPKGVVAIFFGIEPSEMPERNNLKEMRDTFPANTVPH